MSPTDTPTRGASATEPSARVYRGRTVEELIPKIHSELGADAIVLRHRAGLTGGIAGFFQRPFVEIEARPGTPRLDVYDEEWPDLAEEDADELGDEELETDGLELAEPSTCEPAPRAPSPPVSPHLGDVLDPPTATRAGNPLDPAAAIVAEHEARRPGQERLAETFGAALASAERTVALDGLAAPGLQPPDRPDPLLDELERIERGVPARRESSTAHTTHGRAREELEGSLLRLGASEDFARGLLDTALAHVLPFAPHASLARAVQETLVRSIPVRRPLPAAHATLAIVGPGGAGKTSCAAALLGAYRANSTLRASCATILAGEEGERLRMLLSPEILTPTPLDTVASAHALARAREGGLLLLDTPPVSPADRTRTHAISGLLSTLGVDRVLLALPATLGARAAGQLLGALAPLGACAVAITHADETDQLAVAVEACCRFGLAPEYLLERARPGGSFQRIDPNYLAERLLK